VSLRWRWLLVAMLELLVVLLGFILLRSLSNTDAALRWATLVSVVLAYQLGLLWRGLAANHRPGQEILFPTLGPANMLTLARGVGLALLAGFLLAPWPMGLAAWLPALIYTLAAIGDFFDGYLARITDQATVLGETLDMEFDSLAVLLVIALAIWYGQLPMWTLLLGLLRYGFLLGQWLRERQGKPIYGLPESAFRRLVAALFLAFISVILWPIVFPPGTSLAAALFAVPLVLSFSRDWLVTSGQIDPHSTRYQDIQRRWLDVASGSLPLVLRAIVAIAGTILLLTSLANPGGITALLAIPGLPWPQLTAAFNLALALAAIPMVALGWAGWIGTVAMIVPTSAYILNGGLTAGNSLLLASLIALLFTGTGVHSLWQPEARVLLGKVGSRQPPHRALPGTQAMENGVPVPLHSRVPRQEDTTTPPS
jgi:CDP-diacylglycerol--glycerol-3-phosphate 3-phosphatidyltransferase